MLTVDEAQRIVLQSVPQLPAERVPLLDALGCTLSEQVVADLDLPPFDNSAMDGYAVVAADTSGATPENPRALKVVEDLPAGAAPARRVEPGTAARIMTGAPIPPGADAVVMVERTRPGGPGSVAVLEPAAAGDNIRPAGEDIRRGELALSPGEVLGPGEMALLAALGRTSVAVTRRPRASVLITGSELVAPGQPLEHCSLPAGAIYDSNATLMAARLMSAGARVDRCLHAADDERAVEEALRDCADSDIMLTTGGVSVGQYDFVKVALQRLGEIKFWRVLMKPGKPVAFGTVLGRPLFGLPGNPVSALVTFELLVAPALRKMMGRKDCLPPTVHAVLLSDIDHKPGRREYRQAVTRATDDGYVVQASEKRGSAMLTSTVGANSLVVIPEPSPGLRAGEKVTVIYPAYLDWLP